MKGDDILNWNHKLTNDEADCRYSAMSNETALGQEKYVQEWTAPEPPSDLVFDDGEPLETNRHRIAMNVLIDSVLSALAERSDFFAGGNMLGELERSWHKGSFSLKGFN